MNDSISDHDRENFDVIRDTIEMTEKMDIGPISNNEALIKDFENIAGFSREDAEKAAGNVYEQEVNKIY